MSRVQGISGTEDFSTISVKLVYNRISRNRISYFADRFRFIKESTDSGDCKNFLLKTVFRYGQISFKTGFIVLLRISPDPLFKIKANSGSQSTIRDDVQNFKYLQVSNTFNLQKPLLLMQKLLKKKVNILSENDRPPLWSSGQSFWLQIQRSRVRSPALPDFLSSSEPREVN